MCKVPDRKAKDWKDSNPKGYAAWLNERSIIVKNPLKFEQILNQYQLMRMLKERRR